MINAFFKIIPEINEGGLKISVKNGEGETKFPQINGLPKFKYELWDEAGKVILSSETPAEELAQLRFLRSYVNSVLKIERPEKPFLLQIEFFNDHCILKSQVPGLEYSFGKGTSQMPVIHARINNRALVEEVLGLLGIDRKVG